ncbi:hypothetical protein NDA13_005934 [Ustilago tritici]|nr:hypothetical protein NDA13_005934 [Ustilago tritici]
MCVIFWTTSHPTYDLVIASNRDEFLSRPTLPAAWHSFSSPTTSSTSSSYEASHHILSARDATGGGTWLGITRNGAFATLTNFTELSAPLPEGMDLFESRGKLVRDWLSSQSSLKAKRSAEEVKEEVERYLKGLDGKLDRFPGFNLLVGSISTEGTLVGYITNRNADGSLTRNREPDIFLPTNPEGKVPGGMSNSVLSQPWSKVSQGSSTFLSTLNRSHSSEDQIIQELYDLLWTSSTPAPAQRSELRNSVLISPLQLSTAAEGGRDWYATRTSTVILIAKHGRARLVERDTFAVQGGKAVLVNGPEASAAVKGQSGGQRSFEWKIE